MDQLSPTKRALLALKESQAKLAAWERTKFEKIAIVGLGCRFPGNASSPQAYWDLLERGIDAITEVPSSRWHPGELVDPDPEAPGETVSRHGGFVDGIDLFDPQFFNLSPREAQTLDPQQRLLLEVSWEALEHAGQAPERLFDTATGVFLGMSNFDFALEMARVVSRQDLGVYFGTGSALSVNAGRLSYLLGLTGPSLVVDTACSSSLVSLHLACQSLRQRESDLVLAGGVNVLLAPETTISFSRAGLLSPDGRCKTFDGQANGYVRGEGCGIVVLKRLSDALEDGDRILALISGSAVNQDGPSGGLTVPSGPAQERVIRAALANGRIDPAELDYIEAHGTGTSLGDPIEVEALGRVFGANHDDDHPLILGSVKTNIGHLEAAAGIAGILKVVLALEHGKIPPHLHFSQPNPHIPWGDLPFTVPVESRAWQRGEKVRRAAVSSFGFSGTNAHVLLEEAPPVEVAQPEAKGAHLLTLSARNRAALEALAERYTEHLASTAEEDLADLCSTSNVGRSHFEHRLSVVGDSVVALRQALESLASASASAGPSARLVEGVLEHGQAFREPVFLFTGQGTQYPGMGRELFDTQSVFRQALEHCDELLRPRLPRPLLEVLFGSGDDPSTLDQTVFTQPALFALEYALAQVWQSWGIEPAAVLGHSVGEYVAACVAGVFDLESALHLVADRGRRMQDLPQNGAMAAVFAEAERVQEILAPLPPQVSIAVDNGPGGVVVSGEAQAIAGAVARLAESSIECRPLAVSHAFHSALMDPILEDFGRVAASVPASLPTLPMLSNRSGSFVGEEILEGDYWVHHLREPVRFAACLETLAAAGHELFLELGPRPALISSGRRILEGEGDFVWLPSLVQGRSPRHSLLHSLGTLYTLGAPIDWHRLAAGEPRRRLSLPTYPFQRSRHWFLASTELESRLRTSSAGTSSAGTSSVEEQQAMEGSTPEIESAAEARHRTQKLQAMSDLFRELLQLKPEELDLRKPLLEMGADSLILIGAVQAIEKQHGVKVTIRQVLEELTTVEALAAYIADHTEVVVPEQIVEPEEPTESAATDGSPRPLAGAPPMSPAAPVAPATSPAPTSPDPSVAAPGFQAPSAVSVPGSAPRAPLAGGPLAGSSGAGSPVVGGSAAQRIMAQQLQVMSRLMSDQLATLGRAHQRAPGHPGAPAKPAVTRTTLAASMPRLETASVSEGAPAERATSAAPAPGSARDASSPFSTAMSAGPPRALSPRQQEFLATFIEGYSARTARSKQNARDHRAVFSDVRSSILFRSETKEIAYPIQGAKSVGAHFWDVDGNEYVDIAMGFGVNLFGHNPAFIREALEERLRLGIQVGPESDLAGEVATLIHRLTGVERVTFCNSGTEAVMTAIRIARAATGRSKVVLFTGSYHGHSDQTMVLGQKVAGEPRSRPMTLGVPASVAEEALVLTYDDPASLELIRNSAHELAAVLVEPVQSRVPARQPKAFLRQLRQLTEEAGIALIFDEVLLGFRIGNGGAQEWCGVEADVVTYGKVVGGGLPIGVIAGKAAYMDKVDGGVWRFGDDSGPTTGTTFVAGTFSKHPLALTASRAVLQRLLREGPALQEELGRRTSELAAAVNRFAETYDFPVRVDSFGSLFRWTLTGNSTYLYQPLEIDLLFYGLIERGVYTWEGRTCYLSTAHTDRDVEHIVWAMEDSLLALRDGGFWPASKAVPAVGSRSWKRVPALEPPASESRRSDVKTGEVPSRVLVDTYESMPPAALDPALRQRLSTQERGLQFSLSFFGNYSPEFREDKYDLVFEGARFADDRGFTAVWVPERHFHEFGGFSPNPSVMAAALAKTTRRIGLRAGSVVLPLHHPVRVAEEWSVVDNLAKGRVGLSVASGWHPNDFVFEPDNFGQQREVLFERVQKLQEFWHQGGGAYPNGAGESVELELFPKPMQSRLPIWLTIVRNPEMYWKAGELGAGILTNLMGQTLEELAGNIVIYRNSLAEHGFDPASGHVTVLLHTFVTEDAERAREQARAPFCAYLRSSLGLFKGLLRTQDVDVKIEDLSEEDLDVLLAAAYSRYVETAALIGTAETCSPIVERLVQTGVDEAACFVDFGVAPELVLANLPWLDALRLRFQDHGESPEATASARVSAPVPSGEMWSGSR